MIPMPGVYMPQHVPTTATNVDPYTLIATIATFAMLGWLFYLIVMSIKPEPPTNDDLRRNDDDLDPCNDDDLDPWTPPSGGGKPIDIHAWFEPEIYDPYERRGRAGQVPSTPVEQRELISV